MKKLIVIFLAVAMVALIGFFFYGSGSTVPAGDHYQLIKYDNPVSPASDTLRVFTYNIGYLSGMTNNLPVTREPELFDENLQKALFQISKWSPDIAAFQEIDIDSDRSFNRNQVDSIASKVAMSWGYQSVNWDKRYVPFPYWPVDIHFGKVVSGQAILSKFHMVDPMTYVLQKPLNEPFYKNAFYIDRLVQKVSMEIGDQTLVFLNVHLEAFEQETRILQAIRVRELYEQYASEMPVILAGDFNSQLPVADNERSQAMQEILKAKNISASVSIKEYIQDSGKWNTFSTEDPFQRIDYILYNPSHLKVVDTQVLRDFENVSDHFPVYTKFILLQQN